MRTCVRLSLLCSHETLVSLLLELCELALCVGALVEERSEGGEGRGIELEWGRVFSLVVGHAWQVH